MDAERRVPTERRGPLRSLTVGVSLLVAGSLVALLVFGVLARRADTSIDDSLAHARSIAAPPFRLAVLQRGDPGPALKAKTGSIVVDNRVASSELQGTPYVLNFWASWCVPCRQEAPILQRAWRQARPRGVLFVGLDMQDVTQDARHFLAEFGVDYLNLRDPTRDVARSYGVTGVPETFFVSARGAIVNHVIGVLTPAQLRSGVAAAVAGSPEAARQGGARKPSR